MYFFILLNLAIAYVMTSKVSVLHFVLSDVTLYAGIAGIAITLVSAAIRKLPAGLWYDLFACAATLVWLPYWYPDFRDGSPVFFYFPLFFALISALFSLLFIRQRDQIDEQTLLFLQWLSDSGRFNPVLIVVFVLAGLFLKQHFLLYPAAVTLLVMRYALARCLQE